MRLLDVNVLVALAWPTHVHHAAAHAWFAEEGSAGWATCPLTQSGFVRVSSNGRVIRDARRPAEALELLRLMLAVPGHEFWEDDTSIATSPYVATNRIVSHGQVTDAHLLALALRRGGRIVTFDRGVASLLPEDAPRTAVHVLSVAPSR